MHASRRWSGASSFRIQPSPTQTHGKEVRAGASPRYHQPEGGRIQPPERPRQGVLDCRRSGCARRRIRALHAGHEVQHHVAHHRPHAPQAEGGGLRPWKSHGSCRDHRIRRLRVPWLWPVYIAHRAGRSRPTGQHRPGAHPLHGFPAARAQEHLGRLTRRVVRERAGQVLGNARPVVHEPGPLELRNHQSPARSHRRNCQGARSGHDEVQRLHGLREASVRSVQARSSSEGGSKLSDNGRRRPSSSGTRSIPVRCRSTRSRSWWTACPRVPRWFSTDTTKQRPAASKLPPAPPGPKGK